MPLPGYNPDMGQTMKTDVEKKNVDRAFVAHFQVAADDAVAADNDAIIAAFATSASAATVKTNGFTNPAVPRNVSATAGGTAGDIKAVQVVIEGTNYEGDSITETLPAFTVDTAGTVVGSKAFKTITKVTVPAMDGNGANVAIGFGDKLGLPYKLAHNTVHLTFLDNTLEGTAPTVTTDTDEIEKNTIDLNSALNGKVVDAYLYV